MINFFNKVGKRKLIALAVFLVLIIVLPLVLIQVQKQQEIRQRAEGLNNVYLELKPSRDGKNAIDTQFVQTLYLQNPLNKDISGVDITLTYNKDLIDVVDFITEENLSYIIKDINISGEVHLVGINSRPIHIIDSSIPLGAFIFKAKKEGSGAIDFSKVTVTATNETQSLTINPQDNKPGEYSIEQSTLTPSLIPTVQPSVDLAQIPTISSPTSIPTSTPTAIFIPISTRVPTIFESAIFPKKSPVGTFFVLKLKTDPGRRVVVRLNGPGTNYETSMFEEVIEKGTYKSFFDSSNARAGIYTVSFSIKDQNLQTIDQFEVVDLNTVKEACVPIVKNGESSSKLDLVIVPNKYSKEELDNFKNEVLPRHINYLFSKDPFSLNKDKFNIWFVNYQNDFDCSISRGDNCGNLEEFVSQSCSFFDRILVINKDEFIGYVTNHGMAISWDNSSVSNEGPKVTIHELGHSIGVLADEYDMSNGGSGFFKFIAPSSLTNRANCDVYACPKWCAEPSSLEEQKCTGFKTINECVSKIYNGLNCIWISETNMCDYPYDYKGVYNFGKSCQLDTACYYGCGGSDGYRSSVNSIMNNGFEYDEFNAVSKKQLQKMIDSFVK